MAMYGNIFDAFTITFASLSLVFTIVATGGDFWVAYGKFGKENAEGGLWEMCKGTGELKECTPYTEIPGNFIIAQVGMVIASMLLLLGLILSIVAKCSQCSQNGFRILVAILASSMLLGVAAEITAISCFTDETNKLVSSYEELHYGWSYFCGWVAVVFTLFCIGSSIISVFKRRPLVQVTNNMQVIVPGAYVTSVPYTQFAVSTNTTNAY